MNAENKSGNTTIKERCEKVKAYYRNNNPRAAIITVCVLVVVACALVGGAFAFTNSHQGGKGAPIAPVSQKTDARSAINCTVKAEGAQSALTKVKVLAVDAENKTVVSEREIACNESVKLGSLAKGSYCLYVTQAPVCGDGSTYRLPEKLTNFTVDGDASTVNLEVVLEKLPAEEMTQEQLEAASSILEEAGEIDAASVVREKAGDARSVPGSDKTVEHEVETAGTSEQSEYTEPSSDGSFREDPSTSSKPATHTHNWIPKTTTLHHDAEYKTLHHDAEYKTVHHDAEYETVHHDAVKEWRDVCNGCGKVFDNEADREAHQLAAMEAAFDAGETLVPCGAWSTVKVVIQPAWDEQVLVSEAWDEEVLVHDAWDEEVLVSEAWDETITDGYVCSDCGATK